MAQKETIPCPKCDQPLKFRAWSNRYGKLAPWREALADCETKGCGKWAVRYFNGRRTCDPYQVKPPAQKTKRGSWRLSPDQEAAIITLHGSVQSALDYLGKVCMSQQVNS